MDGVPRLPPRVVRAELGRPPLRSLAVRVASRACARQGAAGRRISVSRPVARARGRGVLRRRAPKSASDMSQMFEGPTRTGRLGVVRAASLQCPAEERLERLAALEHPPLAILLLALLDELLGELGRVAARVVRRTLAVRVHLAHAHLAKRHPAGVAHAVRGARARLAEDADGKGVYLAHAPRTLLLIDEPGRLLGGQRPPIAHVLARRVERVVVAAAVLVAQHVVRRLEVEEALALAARREGALTRGAAGCACDAGPGDSAPPRRRCDPGAAPARACGMLF